MKLNIDFAVLNVEDPYILMVTDISEWGFAEDKPSHLFITLPNNKKPLYYEFPKNKDVVFNSLNLGINCRVGGCGEEERLMLPDGIYRIKLQTGYEDLYKERIHLRTHQLRLKLYKLVLKIGEYEKASKCEIEVINKITYSITRAEAYTSKGDEANAITAYREASSAIDQLELGGCHGK